MDVTNNGVQPPHFLRKSRIYKTHYFTKEVAERIIEAETFLDRQLAFQIGYDTGARVGEVLMISAEHFEFDQGFMKLWDSKKRAWKRIPISQKTMLMVQRYLNTTRISTKLFQVEPITPNRWLKYRCGQLGIKPDPDMKIRWHSWRGTFIRTHRQLGDKWLMQVTGDSYATLLMYYEEMTDSDLKKIKDEGMPR
jgi:integrase